MYSITSPSAPTQSRPLGNVQPSGDQHTRSGGRSIGFNTLRTPRPPPPPESWAEDEPMPAIGYVPLLLAPTIPPPPDREGRIPIQASRSAVLSLRTSISIIIVLGACLFQLVHFWPPERWTLRSSSHTASPQSTIPPESDLLWICDTLDQCRLRLEEAADETRRMEIIAWINKSAMHVNKTMVQLQLVREHVLMGIKPLLPVSKRQVQRAEMVSLHKAMTSLVDEISWTNSSLAQAVATLSQLETGLKPLADAAQRKVIDCRDGAVNQFIPVLPYPFQSASVHRQCFDRAQTWSHILTDVGAMVGDVSTRAKKRQEKLSKLIAIWDQGLEQLAVTVARSRAQNCDTPEILFELMMFT